MIAAMPQHAAALTTASVAASELRPSFEALVAVIATNSKPRAGSDEALKSLACLVVDN
jgi:hypothetical protein